MLSDEKAAEITKRLGLATEDPTTNKPRPDEVMLTVRCGDLKSLLADREEQKKVIEGLRAEKKTLVWENDKLIKALRQTITRENFPQDRRE